MIDRLLRPPLEAGLFDLEGAGSFDSVGMPPVLRIRWLCADHRRTFQLLHQGAFTRAELTTTLEQSDAVYVLRDDQACRGVLRALQTWGYRSLTPSFH